MASPETPGDESMERRSGAAGVSCSGTATKLGPSGANVDSQLQDAVHLKTEGNKFYKEKKLRSAIGRYHRSLLILRNLDSDVTAAVKGFGPEAPVLTPGQEELLRNTQVDCYNNLAACLLQRECVDYTRVQEYSLRVLQLRPDDIKALYRAGVATLELGDAQSAKQYLTQASKGQPNDTNVRRHLQRAEERLNTEYQKEKALYRGMFSS
ncbi:tetratricopeptide repeat protein 9C isoform X2 [Oncorhynchus nerka]|nr:tetratricopeptide repeat protein 9C-like isoform X2 [Oncorhynchus nerka]XP_029518665.1 tetratricopeptide repeat protein 9C-like isoform X2 [Oncorhynchus nerka]